MDAAQWPHPQQVGGFSRPMEELAIPQIPNNNNNDMNNNNNTNNPPNNSRASSTSQVVGDQRRARPQKDQNLNCPRCNSTNTKFCYYNNYSLTQPRYFCKTCRRYWTQGGSLRNVPVGGGSRKNKRSSSSSSSSNPSSTSNPSSIPTKIIPDLNPPSSLSHLITPSQNPKFLEGQDLNLAFPIQGIFHNNDQNHDQPINIMNITNNSNNNNNNNNNNNDNNNNSNNSCSTTTTSSTPISALDLLRSGIATRGSLNPFVPMPMPDSNTLYPSGFPNLQDFKPNLNVFSPQNDHNSMVGSGDNNAARLLFPFADMNKLASSTPTTTPPPHHHHHHHEIDHQTNKSENDHHHNQGPTTEYWSGMLGGGTW